MKLLSLHYTNIGPFQDQTIVLNPKNGSYIIKAPIGSGKSVLFFDGPIFAFYKKSARPLLNIKSQKGEVVVEFEHQGIQYCIQRNLSKTKTGESVKSLLWHKPFAGVSENQSDIITRGESRLFIVPGDYERVEFKNETDLQKILDDLLPRKEVLLWTYFLMQDSINIFELPPQERLMILKNIFDLLGIDEIKEKIAEQKREVSSLIKVRSDTNQYDTKLQEALHTILWLWPEVVHLTERYQYKESLSDWQAFVAEQKLLDGKILIEHFSLPKLFDTISLEQIIVSKQEEYQRIKTLQEIAANNLADGKTFLQQGIRKQEDLTQEIQKIEQLLIWIQTLDYEALQKNLQDVQNKQELLWDREQQQSYRDKILSAHFHNSEAQEVLDSLPENITLSQANQTIQTFISLGREYKYRLQSFLEKEELLQTQYNQLTQQIEQSQKNREEFQKVTAEQSEFFCDKIVWNCPYVDLINSGLSKKNKQQEQSLLAQHQILQEQQQAIALQRDDKEKTHQKKQLEQDIAVLWTLLQDLDRKKLQEKTTTRKEFDLQIESLQKEIKNAQIQLQQVSEHKNKLLILQTEQIHVIKSQQETKDRQMKLQEQYEEVQHQFSLLVPPQEMQWDKNNLQKFVQIVTSLESVLLEYKDNLVTIKTLKKKEKMLSELYTIFSKELLLLVIQTNLPKIQDLMNAYLAQVVDYQLSLAIDTKSVNSDALELIVKIHDQYGERQVESLSGGQKVILKLVWMIAISFVTNAPMLFLDETINNIDTDTVAKVADMVTNFIKTKGPDFQFYVITHSQQIQDMGIWDGVITLNN